MAETITMPKLGFDMAEGTLVRWVKNEGENINKGDVLAEIETDKATVEVESSASGVVRKLLVDQGAVVPIGAPIAIVGAADEKIDAPAEGGKPKAGDAPSASETRQAPPKTAPAAQAAAPVAAGPVRASPLAKKLARESRVDLGRVQGSGPGGRIVRKDIEAALAGGAAAAAGTSAPTRAFAMPMPSVVPVSHEDETLPQTKLRQAIARRMTESKTSVPHFYVTHEYRMEALLSMRTQYNAILPEDEKTSVNDYIVKAVALTLREFPNLNASFAGDKVVRRGAVNVGVAVAVEKGLLTVVCRDTDLKPLRQISLELKTMAARARQGKVKPDDIEGSTFSVSNLGMFDVENFLAIVNPPEAGILAVGSAREVPVVEGGQVRAGWRMKATVSVDHRVSDGAEGARFMQALARYIEEPLRLLV
jgi:pyruvate dehydrogenase E2 component (dihydrolipoyllysine-residue acetyltransferase)